MRVLERLAIDFGVTREREPQVESRRKVRLRRYLREELGDAVGSLDAAA